MPQERQDDGVIKQGLAIRDLYPDYVEAGSVYEFLATAYADKKDMAERHRRARALCDMRAAAARRL